LEGVKYATDMLNEILKAVERFRTCLGFGGAKIMDKIVG
jgi:hypothetical protein